MRHPADGVVRRLLDEPAGVADADRQHVASCPICLRELVAARADAAHASTALPADARTEVDVAAGWQRLSSAVSSTTPAPTPYQRRAGRGRAVLRRPTVAALAAAAVFSGAGVAVAQGWLPVFRTERVAPVTITAADLDALPDLDAYGTLVATAEPDLREVPDAATAERETGLDAPQVPDLPRGVSGEPTWSVVDQASATFTFSADRAARTAAEAGQVLPPPPPGLDGSAVRLVAGPGTAATWSRPEGTPTLIVGRAAAPRALSSSGLPFDTLRDYLLSLPGLPSQVADQLRGLNAGSTTLPLPVPADRFTTSAADVDGAPATVVEARDGTLAGVVWVDEGLVSVVAGPLTTDEVLDVARGLR